jgi:hypothetical protein
MEIFGVLRVQFHLVFSLLFWYILRQSGIFVAVLVHFGTFCPFFSPKKMATMLNLIILRNYLDESVIAELVRLRAQVDFRRWKTHPTKLYK